MFLILTAFLLHPVHETIAEVEWNAETKRLEVALRLDVVDAEWIRRRITQEAKRKIDAVGQPRASQQSPPLANQETPTGANDATTIAKGSQLGNWRLQYLKSRFKIDPLAESRVGNQPKSEKVIERKLEHMANQSGSYHWVGLEERQGHVWWFFEIEPRTGKCPVTLEQKILFDKESNQINRVIVLGTKPTRTVIHTARNPRQPIFAENSNVKTK